MLTADHDLGFPTETWSDDFLGEFGWRSEIDDEWTHDWARKWIEKPSPAWVTAPVEGRGLTFGLRQEASGYNFSLVQNFCVILPCPWLMRSLNMSLRDGRDLIYTDPSGREVYKDPSVSMPGRSAGLVDREVFLSFITEKALIPIWVIGGGKELYSERKEAFGQWWFTSIWTLEDGVFRQSTHATDETRRRREDDSE